MKRLIMALWADEAGFILSAELVIIATVAVLGLTVMLVAVRDSIGGEMTDLANSFRNIDQSYGYSGMRGCRTRNGYTSWTAGSGYLDPYLRKDGTEQDIIVEDHVVGTTSFGNKVPCNIPALPPVPACTTPDCLAPGFSAPPMMAPEYPVLQAPVAPGPAPSGLQAPCLDCERQFDNNMVLPPPSSDIPPASMRNSSNYYYPPYSHPVTNSPAGPLQVW